MDADKRANIRAAFLKVADLDDAERDSALDELCDGDTEMRAEVDRLLAADRAAGGFMGKPTADHRSHSTVLSPLKEGPGTRIGNYKLLQLIGEGGFGSVFMAEQERPVRRRVALKIIKLGMDTRQVIARFEAERQALAMMDHPNIAKVLDVGATDTGRPYFIMELVKGIPITEYCDANSLAAADRLDLFIPICRAIQHAHQKGVIHRDIKPSNILVTMHDGKPVPKVIDFGIAKATDHHLTEKTLFTEYKTMVGTPAYMSPEQAEMSGLDIDTRTDIYSLGVLLYELLTGTTPVDAEQLRQAGYAEMQRMIKDVDPPKPSTRVSTLGGSLASIAARRRVEPRRLGLILKGDLDWIVMKSLEKDRTRRYETADALAADVTRHLSGEPVVAAPPSASYRLRKFIRKHRAGVAVSGVIGGTLVVAIVAISIAWWRVRESLKDVQAASDEKDEQFRRAEEEKRKAETARVEAERMRRTAEAGEYAATIASVSSSINAGEIVPARDRLRRCAVGVRNWEWRHLMQCASQPLYIVRDAASPIASAVFSPDGRRIAACAANQIRILDAHDGSELLNLEAAPHILLQADNDEDKPTSANSAMKGDLTLSQLEFSRDGSLLLAITSLAFSHDSKRIVTGSHDGTARIWDVESGDELYNSSQTQVPTNAAAVTCVAYGPDGGSIAVGGADGIVRMLDATLSGVKWQSTPDIGPIDRIVMCRLPLSTTGLRLVAWSGETAKLYDATTGAELATMRGRAPTHADGVFSSDDSRIVTADGHCARIWSAVNGQELAVLDLHGQNVMSAVFSRDGARLLTASADRTAMIWDLIGDEEPRTLVGHDDWLVAAAFSPDAARVVTASIDGTVRVWDADSGKELLVFRDIRGDVVAATFSPSGEQLVAWTHSTAYGWNGSVLSDAPVAMKPLDDHWSGRE